MRTDLSEAEVRLYVESECQWASTRVNKAIAEEKKKDPRLEVNLWYNDCAYRHQCVEFEFQGSFKELDDVGELAMKIATAILGEPRWTTARTANSQPSTPTGTENGSASVGTAGKS